MKLRGFHDVSTTGLPYAHPNAHNLTRERDPIG